MTDTKLNILVLDMQQIDPPIGGGRLRLLGLYHALGNQLSTQYIGTYDWFGAKFRDHQLSPSLREVDIPLSNIHFDENRKLEQSVGGKTLIDTTFHRLAHLSPEYFDYVRNEVSKADVVIFSHPWVFPLVKDLLNKRNQLIVYDSQNVEGLLRFNLLDDGASGTQIVKDIVRIEAELCHFSDLILACSQDDIKLFQKLYEVPIHKMKVVPNGVFTDQIKPVTPVIKTEIKQVLKLENRQIAIFLGSYYTPNLEARDFIINELAPLLPDITFVIAGGVGDGYALNPALNKHNNIIVTGILSDQDRHSYLAASDIAINPMFSGSGTNIKMFDFMAMGLPVVATKIGARGIADTDHAGILIRDRAGFMSSIGKLMNDSKKIEALGRANRYLVEEKYSWEKISPKLGSLLNDQVQKRAAAKLPVSFGVQNTNKFALMSSWNIRCGIAEHSRYLVQSLESNNVDLRIIGNSNIEVENSNLIDDISRDVYSLWFYDYLTWRDTSIDMDGIIQTLNRQGITKLNIQYHPGFFNQQLLVDFVGRLVREKIEVILTLHNSKEVYIQTLNAISNLGVKVIVHNVSDKDWLTGQGIKHVYHVPLGILEFPDEDVESCRDYFGITGSPVIGSFGFLRPHKGLLEVIESISLLKESYPQIKLLAVNALYPSDDSLEYLQLCNQRIAELGLQDNVTIITDFLNIDQVIKYLHATDLIVLPYHDSKEGSSAAANTVIASKRPLVISKSGIFHEIRQVGHELETITPQEIATEVHRLLSNPQLLLEIKAKVLKYVHENSYNQAALTYLEIIKFEVSLD